MARREELGHPLGTVAPAAAPQPPALAVPPASETSARDFVLEIGSEELPPEDVVSGMEQLQERVPALLQRLRLAYESVQVGGRGGVPCVRPLPWSTPLPPMRGMHAAVLQVSSTLTSVRRIPH